MIYTDYSDVDCFRDFEYRSKIFNLLETNNIKSLTVNLDDSGGVHNTINIICIPETKSPIIHEPLEPSINDHWLLWDALKVFCCCAMNPHVLITHTNFDRMPFLFKENGSCKGFLNFDVETRSIFLWKFDGVSRKGISLNR